MEKPMKDFMNDLADLMEQHGVEIDVLEGERVEGVAFTMRSNYDSEANTMIGVDTETIIPFDNITAQDVRRRIEHG